MKKVGIVTWLGSGNYGTSLQAFALHRYLENKGYDVCIITSIPGYSGIKSLIRYVFHVFRISDIIDKLNRRNATARFKKNQDFRKKNFNIPTLIMPIQRTIFINSIDVFLTGSDQIWNTYYKFDPVMFLDFAKNKRKVAYASSIGTNQIKEEYKSEVKNLLLQFEKIGVREKSAVNALSEVTGRNDIVQVIDPTFLLNKNDWNSAFRNKVVEIEVPQKYIFCYLIGSNAEYKAQLEIVKKNTGINNVLIVTSEENPNFSIDDAIVYNSADPLQFVLLLNNSSFVCTDSFHATALSINLQKNFVEFIRFKDSSTESQNSRIYDLLSHYNLMEKIFSKDLIVWSKNIDYSCCYNILNKDRIFSENYLINAIEGINGKK